MTDEYKNYIAGVLDSGCSFQVLSRVGKSGVGYQVLLEINRDQAVLKLLQQVLGGQIQPHKKSWRLRLRGKQVMVIVMFIGPAMKTRGKQMEILRRIWSTMVLGGDPTSEINEFHSQTQSAA